MVYPIKSKGQNNDHNQNKEKLILASIISTMKKSMWISTIVCQTCLEETPASLQAAMWKELQQSSLLHSLTQGLNDSLALGNACSEYRFEVTSELELLVLLLNRMVTQTQYAKSANTSPHLTYLHLPSFDIRQSWKWFMVQDDLQAQDDEILSVIRWCILLLSLVKEWLIRIRSWVIFWE